MDDQSSQAGEPDLGLATRAGLRRLASSVAIVTARDERERFAMSVTAVDAVSLEPPALLVCINQSAAIHRPLDLGADFAINILSRHQFHLAAACGGKLSGEARFSVGHWSDDPIAPILNDCQAVFLCRQDGRFAYGTHTLFIGRVIQVRSSEVHDPLVYADGRYGEFEAHT